MASNVGQRSYFRLELPCNFLKRLEKILKFINLCKDNDLANNENKSLINLPFKQFWCSGMYIFVISIKLHQEYNALQERNTNRSANAEIKGNN